MAVVALGNERGPDGVEKSFAETAGAVDSMQLSLEDVHLKIGETDIPLRSASQKGGTGVLEYHWLEDTGRVALVLYVARDVTLAPAR